MLFISVMRLFSHSFRPPIWYRHSLFSQNPFDCTIFGLKLWQSNTSSDLLRMDSTVNVRPIVDINCLCMPYEMVGKIIAAAANIVDRSSTLRNVLSGYSPI